MKNFKDTQKNNSWFTPDLKKLKASTIRHFYALKSSKDINALEAYKAAATVYKPAVIDAKKDMLTRRILNSQSEAKELFKIFREQEIPHIQHSGLLQKDYAWCMTIQEAMLGKLEKIKEDIALKTSYQIHQWELMK